MNHLNSAYFCILLYCCGFRFYRIQELNTYVIFTRFFYFSSTTCHYINKQMTEHAHIRTYNTHNKHTATGAALHL